MAKIDNCRTREIAQARKEDQSSSKRTRRKRGSFWYEGERSRFLYVYGNQGVTVFDTFVWGCAWWPLITVYPNKRVWQLKPLIYDLEKGTLAWAIAGGLALTVPVTSLFHALSFGPANVVVPIYGMFIVGGSLLGVLFLGEPMTWHKIVGLARRRHRRGAHLDLAKHG
jgi:hypothetical protein